MTAEEQTSGPVSGVLGSRRHQARPKRPGDCLPEERLLLAVTRSLDHGIATSRLRFGMGKTSRLSELWGKSRLLSRVEYDLRSALVPETEYDAFERLLDEAFGVVPDPQVVRIMRWRHFYKARPEKKTGAPRVFGAYALSAVGRPPTVEDAFEAVAVVFTAVDAVIIEASGRVCYRKRIEALADLVAVWLADLLRVIRRCLMPVAYEYADHVPPVASSPCGVIRMASPEVPRGSLRAPQLDAHGLREAGCSWALAA